jgi:TonB family protein
MIVRLLHVAVLLLCSACRGEAGEGEGEGGGKRPGPPRSGFFGVDRPDEAPVMVNKTLPFRYPAALYARKVQGNVTLRLFVDADGRVRAESTKVEESSGFSSLDSAAVVGARELRFIPAKLHGEAMAVSVLFPVYFRHPEAASLPGDTVLTIRQP